MLTSASSSGTRCAKAVCALTQHRATHVTAATASTTIPSGWSVWVGPFSLAFPNLSDVECGQHPEVYVHAWGTHSLFTALDNDECALDNDEEEPACEGGRCVNTVGSYHCTCEPPLVLDGSRRRCVTNESQSLGSPVPAALTMHLRMTKSFPFNPSHALQKTMPSPKKPYPSPN